MVVSVAVTLALAAMLFPVFQPATPVKAAVGKVIDRDRQLAVLTQSTYAWKQAASITLAQDGS